MWLLVQMKSVFQNQNHNQSFYQSWNKNQFWDQNKVWNQNLNHFQLNSENGFKIKNRFKKKIEIHFQLLD